MTLSANSERLKQRFLRYVAIDTTADESSTDYPSSPGQWALGKLLCDELCALGLNATQDQHALVSATLDSNVGSTVPTIVFNAHLDTSPESPGCNVRPQVIDSYAGGDIVLPGDTSKVIQVSENPELDTLKGCTLITTDGTTLLGGDDKAGIAVIMEMVEIFTRHPELPHGPIRILFTCDEEIGRGVDHVDVPSLGATACYTLDGPGANAIDVETFSADLAVVTCRGVNIHPSIAKGRMVNAIRVAGEVVSRLPRETLSPESTDGREGFLHPYQVTGGVEQVVLRILLRDFETSRLQQHASRVRQVAEEVTRLFPGATVDVDVHPQYRNLGDGLRREPRAVAYARQAHQRLGRAAETASIRGGTDGSRLTELGLPTPNLSSGQHNPHSLLEWACLDEMQLAVEVVVELAKVWAEGAG